MEINAWSKREEGQALAGLKNHQLRKGDSNANPEISG